MIVRVSTTILLLTLFASTNADAEDLEPMTVRAHRVTQPIVIDGKLDDGVYHTIESAPATFGPRTAALMNRGVAIKATRLLRY